jgi:hypothetical protein
MAVEVKVSPDERLEYKSVFLEDRRTTSQYFNLTEVPDTFTGGKNAFLIAGTEYLEPNTEVLVQIRDASGRVVYTESSDGNPEYYEGISKVIAVYVYPTDSVEQAIDSTAFGPCTITILGELKYYDNNGSKTEVPEIWKGRYNVRYIGQANINPNLANTTRVRFFRRPQATITELIKPIYNVSGSSSISASAINASYANIKLSRLDTFAGDVKRVKVYRSSASTVSDFELIQDIQIEAKELLQTLNASGSVVTDTGFFNSEVLLNFWNTGSLSSATLNTAHFSGSTAVKLNGAGNFTHKPLLELSQNTVYELAFDAFYTGSAQSNLEIHISSSAGGDRKIDTLVGLFPTKDFTNYVTQFSLSSGSANAYDSSSLYFKQTQDNWYLKDISLRASSETVFSPNEVSFIISMPTNISNETFNFKFEFFDVNNNYIPVAVTGSQTFIGGTNNIANIAGQFAALSSSVTILSSSVSGSLTELSQSVSGTISFTSQSVSGTIANVSSSLSSSISSSLSSSYSSSVYLAESASFALSASLSTSVHTVTSFLDERIFTNSSGSLIKPPKTGSAGLYTSNTHLGYHSGGTWKTYMSDNGSFYLTSSIAGGGFLAWDAADATLQIQGSINITGGNGATTSSVASSINSATSSLSASLAPSIFTDSSGRIRRPPTITPATSGLYISSTNMGYYNGSAWKTYMSDTGNFYLDGATGSLSWIADTDTLEINGVINVIGGNAATQTYANSAANSAASSSQAVAISQASTYVTQLANANWTAGDGTFISGRQISAPVIAGTAGYISSIFKVGQDGITLDGVNKKMYIGTGTYKNTNTPFYFKSGSTDIFSLADKLYWDGTTLTISGNINVTGGNALKTGDAANDVNSGTTTISGTQITTNTINSQQISSLNFTGKTATFDKGTIGGWVINSDSIASKLDGNGRSRLRLSPTPEIRVNDVDGNGKLFIRAGALTTPTNSSISVTPNFSSVTLPNTTSVDYQAFTDGGYQTFTVTSPGAYNGTISAGAYSSVAYMSDSSWTGYMYVGLSYQIASNSTFTALIADGVITSKGVGSYSENGSSTQLDLPSTTVGINLSLAAGTYYSRLRWTVIYYSEVGTITVNSVSSGAKAPSLALTNTLAEFTDEGLQLIYDADTYFRIQRGSLQGSNLDAYVKIGGKLEVTGDIVSLASDKRLKENIIPIDGALDKIDKINGVYFNYTNNAKEANPHFADGRQVGLIAQEIQEVLPEVISFAPFDYGVDSQNISGENYLTLNYDKVVPLLLQAIKELKCELDDVKKLIK